MRGGKDNGVYHVDDLFNDIMYNLKNEFLSLHQRKELRQMIRSTKKGGKRIYKKTRKHRNKKKSRKQYKKRKN